MKWIEMDNFQCALEVVLSTLLFITIIYCAYLGKSLAALRRDRGAISALVSSLQESSRQAELGIDQLHRTSDSVGRQLGKQTEQARVMKAEMAGIIEKAEIIADRLDRSLRLGKAVVDQREQPVSRDLQASFDRQMIDANHKNKSIAELDLMRALRMK